MTKQRITKKVVQDVTREHAVEAFAALAVASASNKKINADMELKFAEIREKNQARLEENATVIEESTEILKAFLEQHPEVLGKKRSVELTHGTIGYRLGQPALKTKKGFTWEACTNLIKELLKTKNGQQYYRTTEVIDKEKLLADRELPITDVLEFAATDPVMQKPESERPRFSEYFEKWGFNVKQDETFYVEPKVEEPVTA